MEKVINVPVLAVKNTVVFPSTTSLLLIGRKVSVNALNVAREKDEKILVLTQKRTPETNSEDISQKDLYNVGTLCQISNIKGSDEMGYQILVKGLYKYTISNIKRKEETLWAEAEIALEEEKEDSESCALYNNTKSMLREVFSLLPGADDNISRLVDQIQGQVELSYFCANNIKIDVEQQQKLLEESDPTKKMKMVLDLMNKEREVLLLEKDLKDRVGKKVSKSQREALLREQLQAIKEELGEEEEEKGEYEERIVKAEMSPQVEKMARNELKRLESLPYNSAEAPVIKNHLEWLISMPWNKSTEDNINLEKAREILDTRHYGLEKIKKRILEHLAVTKLKGDFQGTILCLLGPPGVGKTSLCRSIADAIGREFVRTSLGGVRDESEIKGHRRTYVGALPGKLISSLKKSASNNPLILLDEIDKLVVGPQGDPSAALLEALDPEQNKEFIDHFLDAPFDLSNVFFIATANRLDTIHPTLRDRLEIIELSSYTMREKVYIAKNYLLPEALKEHGLEEKKFTIDDKTLEEVIEYYTREPGLRQLKRVTASLCRHLAYEVVEEQVKSTHLDHSSIRDILGPPTYISSNRPKTWSPGVVTGLSWTPVGGDILYIESLDMPGTGKLKVTGQLGDVMKESADIALSFVRSNEQLTKKPFNFSEKDIHIHVPAGSIPKDGPSAGITIATSLASLVSNTKISKDLAMTGELTLSGEILPVGGIKEKVLAAHRNDIKTVILPKLNEKDLEEVPQEIRDEINIETVESIQDVFNTVFNASKVTPPKSRDDSPPRQEIH